ncbi:MAG: site-2 protease family protein [Candidatus Asgardarchaeia archaeon]
MAYPYHMMDVQTIKDIVSRYFNIVDYVFDAIDNVLDFKVILDKDVKNNFEELYFTLKEQYDLACLIRRISQDFGLLRVFKMKKRESRIITNIIMLLATIATIVYSGWLFATTPLFQELYHVNPLITTLQFSLALFSIVAIHETGHLIASRKNKVETSLPYFIPGLPTIGGTFGAVIVQKTPPHNRDVLFDIGFSGPIAGFIVAVIVTIIGILMSIPISQRELARLAEEYPEQIGTIPVPLLFIFLENMVKPTPAGYELMLHPVAFAGWVGFVITGLNLFPASQLDGGHISRALFGYEMHNKITLLSGLILIIIGFVPMGILVLILHTYSKHPGALDDVSDLTTSRKILGIFAFLLVILCTPPFFIF